MPDRRWANPAVRIPFPIKTVRLPSLTSTDLSIDTMSGAPPPYETATGKPSLNITSPQGQTHRANSKDGTNNQGNLQRMRSSDSVSSTVSSDGGFKSGVPEDDRRSMDDEMRDLPKGWVRCFDSKWIPSSSTKWSSLNRNLFSSGHHFYVDEATKRSSWIHPYDDAEFLQTLPNTHPANPNSAQAKAVQKHAEDEARLRQKMDNDKNGATGHMSPSARSGAEHRNWLQRKADQVIGTPQERAKAKEERHRIRAEQEKKQRVSWKAFKALEYC